ncbi:MAG TPA: SGNH/GDSL hydrolase family protein [Ruminiclostridium sp.]
MQNNSFEKKSTNYETFNKEMNSPTAYEQGDRICFIGDSITHCNFYMASIYEFYLTRFPEKKIDFYNCGIAGEKCKNVIRRLDYDILCHHPNKAVIMLGMNDVDRDLYTATNNIEAQFEQREKIFETYKSNMEHLVHMLSDNGIEITLCTPTPYDQTALIEEKVFFGVDDALTRFSEIITGIAKKSGCALLDFHSCMNEINKQVQKVNPQNTITSSDRVHPGETGIQLMVYFFLRNQGFSSEAVLINIDYKNKSILDVYNCEIENMNIEPTSLSFTINPHAFPMNNNEFYTQADFYVPLTKDLNREMLHLCNLPEGNYTLYVDEIELGCFTTKEFIAGINLSLLKGYPGLSYTRSIHELNLIRFETEQKLRTITYIETIMIENEINLEDKHKIKQFFLSFLDKIKAEPYHDYIFKQVQLYYEFKPQEKDLSKQLSIDMNHLSEYAEKNPQKYQISIKRVL